MVKKLHAVALSALFTKTCSNLYCSDKQSYIFWFKNLYQLHQPKLSFFPFNDVYSPNELKVTASNEYTVKFYIKTSRLKSYFS